MKILVVDDERPLVKGMKFNLESEGYSVERLEPEAGAAGGNTQHPVSFYWAFLFCRLSESAI